MGFVVFGSSCGHSYLAYWVLVIIWDTNPATQPATACTTTRSVVSHGTYICHMGHLSIRYRAVPSNQRRSRQLPSPSPLLHGHAVLCSGGWEKTRSTEPRLPSPPSRLCLPQLCHLRWQDVCLDRTLWTIRRYYTQQILLGIFLSTPTSTLTNGTTVLCYTYVHFVVT